MSRALHELKRGRKAKDIILNGPTLTLNEYVVWGVGVFKTKREAQLNWLFSRLGGRP